MRHRRAARARRAALRAPARLGGRGRGAGPPRGCGSPAAPRSRSRWTAGSRRSTTPTARCSSRRPGRCSTSAAGRAATSRRSSQPASTALGLDLSPVAVRLARARGAEAILRSVFADVPGAGRWRTALLLDGNIGIGGAPVPLLERARERSSRAAGRCWSRRRRPAPRRAASASGSRRPARSASGSAGRRSAPTTSRASRAPPASASASGSRPAAAGSPGWSGRDPGAARPVPAGLLALAAARAVADGRARLGPARAGDDRRRDRLPLARRLPAGPRLATRSSAPTCRSRRSSAGRAGRRGCTRSTRACTSTSGWR